MTIMLYVCGNAETVCDGYLDDRLYGYGEEIASAFVDAAGNVITNSPLDVDYEVGIHFRDWHGGKYYRAGRKVGSQPWGYSAGLVVCLDKDVPAEVQALCDAAAEAGHKARENMIETLSDTGHEPLPPELQAHFGPMSDELIWGDEDSYESLAAKFKSMNGLDAVKVFLLVTRHPEHTVGDDELGRFAEYLRVFDETS